MTVHMIFFFNFKLSKDCHLIIETNTIKLLVLLYANLFYCVYLGRIWQGACFCITPDTFIHV